MFGEDLGLLGVFGVGGGLLVALWLREGGVALS